MLLTVTNPSDLTWRPHQITADTHFVVLVPLNNLIRRLSGVLCRMLFHRIFHSLLQQGRWCFTYQMLTLLLQQWPHTIENSQRPTNISKVEKKREPPQDLPAVHDRLQQATNTRLPIHSPIPCAWMVRQINAGHTQNQNLSQYSNMLQQVCILCEALVIGV